MLSTYQGRPDKAQEEASRTKGDIGYLKKEGIFQKAEVVSKEKK